MSGNANDAKSGAYGVVTFLVRDGTRLAKKTLDMQTVYKNEVSVLRALDGVPYVTPLIEADDKSMTFIMPRFDTDLFTLTYTHFLSLSASSRLRTIGSIMRRIVRGLAQIHKRGYVHMDIKGKNVLIKFEDFKKEDKERTKVTDVALGDFGTAMRIGTHIACPTGTISYAPPEVLAATDADPVTAHPSMDMYCLGVTMAMTMTGQLKKPEAFLCASAIATPDASDFISAITAMNPKLRLTALQALDHPFLKK